MEKYVITISRQYGSFGRLVAKKLSEQLHIDFLDRDIVEETAKRMNTSVKQISREEEITHSKFSYLSYPFGLGTPDVSDEIFLVQQSIIEDFARKGSCIIVGRCADKILEETEGLISLFIYAPMEARVKEIMRRYETDEKEAEYLIKQADKIRKNYYNFYAKKTWADKASYNMLIDSSRISEKELAAMLRALLTARGVELETDGSDQ